MPVDPSFIGLAMKAMNKAVDTSYGEKALDRLVKKPQVDKNRKKKRSADSKRPTGVRRRSERQAARRSAGVNDGQPVVDQEPPQFQQKQDAIDRNGPGNLSGFTYSTCGTTAKTNKYQPVLG